MTFVKGAGAFIVPKRRSGSSIEQTDERVINSFLRLNDTPDNRNRLRIRVIERQGEFLLQRCAASGGLRINVIDSQVGKADGVLRGCR